LGIDINNKLWVWGRNTSGELGIGISDYDKHPTPIQLGNSNWKWVS